MKSVPLLEPLDALQSRRDLPVVQLFRRESLAIRPEFRDADMQQLLLDNGPRRPLDLLSKRRSDAHDLLPWSASQIKRDKALTDFVILSLIAMLSNNLS